MARRFTAPPEVIAVVVTKMKAQKIVHPDAQFNESAHGGWRREIAYRDIDFLERLGQSENEVAIVEAAVKYLKRIGLVDDVSMYDAVEFDAFRKHIAASHTNRSWSSFSPTMERLFYALTCLKKPKRMCELGCFWGNTLAWFAGPCIGPDRKLTPEFIYGIDMDKKAIEMARDNFTRVTNAECVRLIDENAFDVIERLEDKIDFLYIETKSKDGNHYLPLLKLIYPKLSDGAWVLAHDSTRFTMLDEFVSYLSFVRDKAHFSESISFDVDSFGVELSIK